MKYEAQLFFNLTFFVSISAGQNLQIHYDFAEDRRYFTSTLEMYRPDEKGATFWFVDFDYNQPGNKSASVGYWEFARYMNLSFLEGLSGTLQFNDGVSRWGPLGHVWLAGITYPVDLSKSHTFEYHISRIKFENDSKTYMFTPSEGLLRID